MTLEERLNEQPYQGYAYAYPHKMAYRKLEPEIPLEPLWAREDREALFLYVHIPFCEVRCGFCNLFTTTNANSGYVEAYLEALGRQMKTVGELLGAHRFARAAFGGGTPTFLSEQELERLFALVDTHLSGPKVGASVSFEMSPATVTPEKLRLLIERRVTRASIGVQSFVDGEVRAIGRPQDPREVTLALDRIRGAGFRVFNLDLIYGAANQTPASWRYSLEQAFRYRPEEIYLYPLYVRPLTGLDRLHREPSDLRLQLYREGREFLLANGYRQISMRLFRRAGTQTELSEGPIYCCQEDGMLGFGAGARSYTQSLHYSSEYAVGRDGVRGIIEEFNGRTAAQFASADYGCFLDREEQQRRYVIKSLLRCDGLDLDVYRERFQTEALTDFPCLKDLKELGLAVLTEGEEVGKKLILTEAGLERSDTIGPWLFSAEMQSRMEDFDLV